MEICERLNDVTEQARSSQGLASPSHGDKQLDAAEEAASRSIDLLPDSRQFEASQGRRVLGDICRPKGETEKAVNHFEAALRIASSFNWHHRQLRILYSLAALFCHQGWFDDAHIRIERSKSYAVDDTYNLGRAIEMQARILNKQGRFEEAISEALYAVGVFEKLGATRELEGCRQLLQDIEGKTKTSAAFGSDFDGELSEMVPLPALVDSPHSARGTEWWRRRLPRFLSPYPPANREPHPRLN